jgi:hypothetical protein
MPAPKLVTISPDSGKGGDVIKLDGENLSGVQRVIFVDSQGDQNEGKDLSVVSNAEVQVTVPTSMAAGKAKVHAVDGKNINSNQLPFSVTG